MSEKSEGTPIGRRQFLGLSAVAAASAAIVLAGWDIREAHADTGDVFTIIHTNDVHSYVAVSPYVKGLKDSLEASGAAPVLVSAGDDFAGTPFASLSAGQDVAIVMNMVGYDMMTIGNHEYMMAPAAFKAVVDTLNFPVLACNPLPSTLQDSPSIAPYQIVEFTGRKIAFIGIGYNQPGAPEMINAIETARGAATGEGAEIFIGISHLGITDSDPQNQSYYVADSCPWFTAIIDGHSHSVLPSGEMRNTVLIAQTGEYGNNIGVTEITLDTPSAQAPDGVVGCTAKLIAIKGSESTCGITPDVAVQAYIDEVNDRNSFINEPVFSLPVMLNGSRPDVRMGETTFGNFVVDAMRAKTGTDIAFTSGASLRSNVGPGDVTRGELQTALMAETDLARIEISGAEVLAILETGFSAYPLEYFLFPHVSGISVAFDGTKEVGSRVVYAATTDGALIDPAKTYSCTVRADIVSVYVAAGAAAVDGVDFFTGYGTQSEAVIDYANNNVISGELDRRLRMRGNSYVINFDGNGATAGTMAAQTFAYDEEVTLPKLGFTYSDYPFTGWLDNLGRLHEDGAKAVNFDLAAMGEITLVAQWEVPSSAGNPATPIDKGTGTPSGKLPSTGDASPLQVAAGVVAVSSLGAAIAAAKTELSE